MENGEEERQRKRTKRGGTCDLCSEGRNRNAKPLRKIGCEEGGGEFPLYLMKTVVSGMTV